MAICEKLDIRYEIDWTIFGYPFRTPRGEFTEAISQAIKQITGHNTEFSTTGGTSDGRFIAPTGAEVVELGPINATIHKVNECVAIDDLELLSLIYEQILSRLLIED